MKQVTTLLICAAAVSLAGCVSTNATMLGDAPAGAPVEASQVRIYRTADQVPSRYREVALLNSAGDSMMTNEAKMHESMKRQAAKLGADGIILDSMSEPTAATKVAAAVLGGSAQRKGRAIAIKMEPATAQ